MNKTKTICALFCIVVLSSMMLLAQTPLSNNVAAVGVLGQTDLVSNANGLSASKVYTPKGIAIDPTTGKLFVADYDNRRVLRWSSVDKMTNGAAAEAVLGQPDFVTNSSGTSSTKMARPYGITVDAAGRLWVSDLSNNRVLRFDNASTIASGAAANGVLGQADFTTATANTGGISASTMSGPIGVFVDKAGRLWVAERDNKRVLRFDNAAAKEKGDAANGVLGEPDFATNAGGLSASLITRGYGITGDTSGRIWVSDRDNNRVLRFDAAATKANGAVADGVIGQPDFVTNTIGRTQSRISGPRGVFIDPAGKLYVTDEGNNRVMIFDSAATKGNGPNAVNLLGQTDYFSDFSPATPTAGSVNYPEFLVIDKVYKFIWLADEYNNRIVRYMGDGTPVNILAPAAPKNLVAVRGNAQVTLKWNKNTEADFVQYKIYGGTAANPTTLIAAGISDTMKIVTSLTNETKYYFRITAVNFNGMESGYSTEVSVTPSTTGFGNDGNSIPIVYSLSQNYPNPFNPATTINFGLPEANDVSLKIYDVLGREITTLFHNELSAGYHSYQWNASGLASGVYIYRINATSSKGDKQQNFTQVKKLMLQK